MEPVAGLAAALGQSAAAGFGLPGGLGAFVTDPLGVAGADPRPIRKPAPARTTATRAAAAMRRAGWR
jgi:hypothetical protein